MSWKDEWREEHPDQPIPKFDPKNPPVRVKKWIARMKKCLDACPDDVVWLYACSSGLAVMVLDDNGDIVTGYKGGMDQDYLVDSHTPDVWLDGGDW